MSKTCTPDLQDAYKRIRSNVDLSNRPSNILAVLSARPKEGRSTVAYNLAASFADKGDKVLLINADMTSDELDSIVGVSHKKGLSDAAKAFDPYKPVFHAELAESVELPSGAVLFYIPAGKEGRGRDVIHSKAFHKLIKEAAREMDKIILDSPAALNNADAYAIGAAADEAIFVYDAKHTSKYEAKEAMDDLERNGSKIEGIVMTGVR